MPTLSFVRDTSEQPLMWLSEVAGPPGYAVGLLPAAGVQATQLTIPESWGAGVYLFLNAAPDDEDGFVAQLRGLLPAQAFAVWLRDPNTNPAGWALQVLEVAFDGAEARVFRAGVLTLRNYALVVGAGCAASLTGDQLGFQLSAVAGRASSLRMEARRGATWWPTDTLTQSFAAAPGALAFSITVEPGGEDALDLCCLYLIDDTRWPTAGFLRPLRYPLFSLDSALTLQARVDPLNPLLPERSHLGIPTEASPLPSMFRTVYGQVALLTPVSTSAWPEGPRLVFGLRPNVPDAGPESDLYLCVEGSFQVTAAGTTGVVRLMTGTSGVEYARLSPDAEVYLHFISGQPSYASPDGGLDPRGTTSWAWITSAQLDDADYVAQPESSVLYGRAVEQLGYFDYVESPAGRFGDTLELPPGDEVTAFPMVPYGGVAPEDVEPMAELEAEVLTPTRRQALDAGLVPYPQPPSDDGQPAVTPQGLLIELDDSKEWWEALILAQNTLPGGEVQTLRFDDVQGGFRAALQSSQLFLVVSVPQALLSGDACTVDGDFILTVDGWSFLLHPSQWLLPSSGAGPWTMMLVKYASRSLSALAADTRAWGWPEAATPAGGSLQQTQDALLAWIADARQRAATEKVYQDLVEEIIDRPGWTGVLFIDSPLSGDSLPPQVQGLTAGINPSLFYAHHVALDATPIEADEQGYPSQTDSSVSALISYSDPVDLYYTGVDYGYKVLSLKIVFENSAMVDFSSQIELYINALFGDLALLEDSQRGNNLILDGYYQRHEEVESYVFTDQQDHVFTMSGGALDRVVISQARMVTVFAGGSSDEVVNAFQLDGRLQLADLPGADLLSFGAEADDDGTTGGLRFSGLSILMRSTQGSEAPPTFSFDASALSFDLPRSLAREGSLYSHFPLALEGFIEGTPGTSPGDLGYMSTRSPLPQSALTAPWYGLTYSLVLGTLGSLASDAGLEVSLITAWQAGVDDAKVYLGLKLPGSVNANSEIPLEGVLKLAFGAIELLVTGEDAQRGYMLRLRRVALRLLGFSFPQGQIDLVMFGDPSGQHRDSLGWYLAYDADGKG